MMSAPSSVNLSLLSVLVVEDIGFIRLLFTSVLRSLGIENIHIAENGADAVRIISEKAKSLPDGTPPFDIVFSDLLMPEVDGFMLLKWLRISANTPDRFIPVAVVSAAADLNYIQRARDLGMNEFIAKPFATQTVWDRLMGLIYKPRRFILGGGYFGPDRRRTQRAIAEDRRKTKPEDIQIIRTSTKKLNIENAAVMHFEFTNRLAAKVGGLARGAEIPKIDVSILKKVEEQISSMAGDYSTWIGDEIKRLDHAVQELKSPDVNLRQVITTINRGSHEMRGQGGIFGYPLITEFSKSLFLTTNRHYNSLSENEYELIKAHVDAIKVVINEKVEGDGGDVGRALLTGLQAAIKKYS